MTIYPITVQPLKPYHGADEKKRLKYEDELRAAARIEQYINGKMEGGPRERPSEMFVFRDIAFALDLTEAQVVDLLYKHQGSSTNAIEVHYAKPI